MSNSKKKLLCVLCRAGAGTGAFAGDGWEGRPEKWEDFHLSEGLHVQEGPQQEEVGRRRMEEEGGHSGKAGEG